jgi:repressor LexA
MNGLTARQKELYDFIVKHVAENRFQPSYHEMMRHMWVSSPNAIRCLIVAMEKKGYVQRTGGNRSLQILRKEH